MSVDIKQDCQALLGAYLKFTRRKRDLTQEEVGINVGYSPHTAKQAISQIERGVTWVPDKKLKEFVSFLELNKSFFSLLSHYYSIKNYAKVQEMIKMLLNLDSLPKPDDAADALGIAICQIHTGQYNAVTGE